MAGSPRTRSGPQRMLHARADGARHRAPSRPLRHSRRRSSPAPGTMSTTDAPERSTRRDERRCTSSCTKRCTAPGGHMQVRWYTSNGVAASLSPALSRCPRQDSNRGLPLRRPCPSPGLAVEVGPVGLLKSDPGVVGDGSATHVNDLGNRVPAGQSHGAVEMGDEVSGKARTVLATRSSGLRGIPGCVPRAPRSRPSSASRRHG
jgi:hypothetical protein